MQVELNQKTITAQSGLYHYRAYIENLLNYGADAKNTHLLSSLFVKDSATHMEAGDLNTGYVKRKNLTREEFELEAPVHSDIFNQDKLLLSGVKINIKFYRSKPEFALMVKAADTEGYKIKITEAVLIMRRVKISPPVQIAHETTLKRHTAKYPVKRCEIKSVTLPANHQSIQFSLDKWQNE